MLMRKSFKNGKMGSFNQFCLPTNLTISITPMKLEFSGSCYQTIHLGSLEDLITELNSRNRASVLVGANMTGTDKLPLLIIGKSKNPRAFRNMTVPVDYHANKKAWMTSILFENWLRNLDKRMGREKRKSP